MMSVFKSAVVANCPFKTHLGGNWILSLAKWGPYCFLVIIVSVCGGNFVEFGIFLVRHLHGAWSSHSLKVTWLLLLLFW